jgi:hypothetical protein
MAVIMIKLLVKKTSWCTTLKMCNRQLTKLLCVSVSNSRLEIITPFLLSWTDSSRLISKRTVCKDGSHASVLKKRTGIFSKKSMETSTKSTFKCRLKLLSQLSLWTRMIRSAKNVIFLNSKSSKLWNNNAELLKKRDLD